MRAQRSGASATTPRPRVRINNVAAAAAVVENITTPIGTALLCPATPTNGEAIAPAVY